MKTGSIWVNVIVATLVSSRILTAAAAIPDPSPGQAVSVREGDKWSSATFQRKEGRKYLIQYSDGTTEWIMADRLRVEGATSAGIPSKPGEPEAGAGNATNISLSGPFTEIDLQPAKARIVPRREISPLSVKPATRPSVPFTDLTPASGTALTGAEDIVICPDTPDAVAVIGARQDDDNPLMCIDVNHPSSTTTRVLTAHEHKIIAVAHQCQSVLTQPTAWGTDTLSLWEYRDGQYGLKANYTFVSGGQNKHPDWARLLSPTRLLLRCGFGETYLIDLATKQQIAYIQCGDLAIHCSGQYVLSSKDRTGIVLKISDLAIAAEIPNVQSLSVDPTGTYAVAGDGHSVAVTKLGSKVPVAQTGGLAGNRHIDLIGPTALLVDGRIYYDLRTGIPVWSYDAPGSKSLLLANGQMLYASVIDGQVAACMAEIPDEAATNALRSASPDKFLITPGAHVAIAGDLAAIGNAAEARKNLERALTSAGHRPDDAAPQYKLTVTTATGPTGKFPFQVFQMGGPPLIKEVDAPSTISTVVLSKDSINIWQREIKFSAEGIVNRRRDQTVEQAIAEAGKPNPGRLVYLDIPGYIVKAATQGTLASIGESSLTRTGFTASASTSKDGVKQ